MQKVLYLLTLLLITVYTYADVSPVVINRLTNNEGLSNSSVNVIYQDSNNLMWFGTWDGLNLYNSREFKTFKPNPNVPGNITNNIIRDIIETTKGRLWITTDNGINLYTPEAMRFQSFFYDNKENSIFKERSFLICKNSHNKVIASVYNTGLYYFDEELSDFILIRNLKETSLKKLFFDKDDNLWLFTDNNSLYRVNLDWSKNKPDIKDIKPVILSQSSHDVFYNLYTNQIWEQNENRHINIYDVPTETKITEIPFSKVISSIIFEKTGYVIGTANGLFSIQAQNHEITTLIEDIPVFSIYKGTQDILWVGTDGQGVIMLTPKNNRFTSYSLKNSSIYGLSPVRCFWENQNKQLFIGTKGSGLYIFQDDTTENLFAQFTTNNGLINNSVYALAGKENDICWIGTDGKGLNYWDYKTKKLYTLKMNEKLDIISVYAIYIQNDHTLWIGTNGFGLYKLTIDRSKTPYEVTEYKQFIYQDHNKKGLSNNVIFSIIPDDHNGLWIGTRGGGLNHLDTHTYTFTTYRFSEKEMSSISNNDIITLYKDPDHQLWIGTSLGLNLMQKDEKETISFKHYTEKDGMPNNTIHGIQADNDGNIWISTNKGLGKLSKNNDKIISYYQNDGLQNNEFSDGASYKSSYTNNLFFGGINGYNKFDPQSIPETTFSPRLNFDDFLINNENADIRKFTKKINGKKMIVLNHTENLIGFKFTPIDYISGMKCEIEYKLAPYEKNWIQMGTSQLIVLNKLPSDDYILKIRFNNANKIWSEDIYEIPIRILPPWWLSKWAYLFYFLTSISILFVIYSVVKNRIQMKHTLELSNLEKTKTEEIHQAKLRFFTNIAHEFSNSLTLILVPSEQLLKIRNMEPEAKRYVRTIHSNAGRMQKLIQELIEFRKAETGFLELQTEIVDIHEFVKYITDYFTNTAAQKNIQFSIQIQDDTNTWITDRSCFEKIVFNIISNAFKYTPINGYIHLSISQINEHLILQIKNNGKGIKKEDIHLIFNRFKILDQFEKQMAQGENRNGIGLALCKALTDLLKGTIEVESELNDYTQFTISLPALELTNKQPGSMPPLVTEEPPINTEYTDITELADTDTNNMSQTVILIVEDDKEISNLLYGLLKHKYSLLFASNGKEGVEMVEKNSIHLIISDIIMPEMNGIEFVNHLKGKSTTANIPVIFLSSRTSIDNQIEGLQTGADAYVGKPFNSMLLETTIDRLLTSRRSLKDFYASPLSAIEKIEGKTVHKEEKEFILKLTRIVSENIDNENLSIEMLSNEMGISKIMLYRKLKEIKEETPTEFIRKIRMNQVEKLLKMTNKTIQEIMFDCGFNNKAYFYHEFSKQFNLTPGEYRKKHGLKAMNE